MPVIQAADILRFGAAVSDDGVVDHLIKAVGAVLLRFLQLPGGLRLF